jgi:DNA-directed RNA polymerase sigma subunit (sigma70/sigma32)
MEEEDINRQIYKQIKEQQLNLTEKEQNGICLEIDGILKQISYLSWLNPKARDLLILEWQRRRTVSSYTPISANVSKMGKDYNSSKSGHNKQVRKRVNDAFKMARYHIEFCDEEDVSANIFVNVNLHPAFLVTNNHIPILDVHTDEVKELIVKLDSLRILLTRSVMKAASEIAHHKFGPLVGEIIDLSDLIQEARISAFEGTLIFDMNRDTKWSTFAYSRMKNEVGKYVAENSRTVALPRTILDQFIPVQEAIDQVGVTDYEKIALLANQINADRKMRSSGRKLRAKEIYTPEKVEWFLQNVTEWMSLDMIINESADENREVPLVEILTKNVNETEAIVERSLVSDNMKEFLQGYLTEEEWEVLSYKWGLDYEHDCRWGDDCDIHPTGVREYDAVVEILNQLHPGKKVHRLKVREIEMNAINKLKKCKEKLLPFCEALDDLRLKEV